MAAKKGPKPADWKTPAKYAGLLLLAGAILNPMIKDGIRGPTAVDSIDGRPVRQLPRVAEPDYDFWAWLTDNHSLGDYFKGWDQPLRVQFGPIRPYGREVVPDTRAYRTFHYQQNYRRPYQSDY